MSLRSRIGLEGPLLWISAAVVTAVAFWLVAATVDVDVLRRAVTAGLARPGSAALALAAYLLAFVLRAVAWRRVVPSLPFAHALAGIHLALGGNHVLPFRLGEPLRVTRATRSTDVPVAVATASTLLLRAGDIVAVLGLALLTGPAAVASVTSGWGWVLLPVAVLGVVAGLIWLRRSGYADRVRMPGAGVLVLTVTAWLLEAVVVLTVAGWAGVVLSPIDAVLVTSVTVAAQTVAIAPGGFGTYEAAATAVLVTLGVDPGTALAVALTAHAVKTVYSLVAGAVALRFPRDGRRGQPTLGGRRRLRLGPVTTRPERPARATATAESPVVVFMPAYEEEACIESVIARVPDSCLGRRVELVVVDDGSRDRTAELARLAGATRVVEMGQNRGLGAAVRRGLAEALSHEPAVVVYCDADGEYPPEELEALVAPVLSGEADYVIGSRFAGRIDRMLPHRRLGNRVLTRGVRFMTRLPVTDGQSGYRAFTPGAAAAAEVIHDFNYAQVLTLDLVAKGFTYAEVPISYRFRETGESFIKLGRYLRAVVPAVWRELNDLDPAGSDEVTVAGERARLGSQASSATSR